MGKSSANSGSKSDGKFGKKLEFYARVKDAVASLSAQKSISKKKNKQRSRQKKLKAYNLSALSDSLPELKAPRQPARKDEFKLNCKSRQKLVVKEREWLLKNLSDPSFQLDPLSAIHQHILSTQPAVEEHPKKNVNKNGSKKKKEKKLKSSVVPQYMDL